MVTPQKGLGPLRFHVLVGFGLAAALTLLIGALTDWPPTFLNWVLLWLVAINFVTFGYYGYDKGRAIRYGRRVPELLLHSLALAGGTLGAFAGMQCFRHKTLKGQFRLTFYGIAAVQALLLVGLVRWLWFS